MNASKGKPFESTMAAFRLSAGKGGGCRGGVTPPLRLDQFLEFGFREDLDAERPGLAEFGTGVFAQHEKVGLFEKASGGVAAQAPDPGLGLGPTEMLEGSGNDHALSRQRSSRLGRFHPIRSHTRLFKSRQNLFG